METGDRKLNEVKKVTDMAYVPVIMEDGSIGQIAKSDLASVVAGQMVTSNLFPFAFRVSEPDANECIDSGIYRVSFMSNVPVNYGLLIVFSDSAYIFQIAASVTDHLYYFRYKNEVEWGSWCNISVNV